MERLEVDKLSRNICRPVILNTQIKIKEIVFPSPPDISSSYIPYDFPIFTNIKYNDANLKMIKEGMKLKEIYKPIQFKGYNTWAEQKTDVNGWIYPEMDLGICNDYSSNPILSPGTYVAGRYVGITPPWKTSYPPDASFNNPNGLSNPKESDKS